MDVVQIYPQPVNHILTLDEQQEGPGGMMKGVSGAVTGTVETPKPLGVVGAWISDSDSDSIFIL
jgi:hypothetical protein